MQIHEMRKLRDELLSKAEAIIDKCELENRDLTAEESREVDGLNTRAARLNERVRIKSEVLQADEAARRSAEQPAPIKPAPAKPEQRGDDERPQFRTKAGDVVEARSYGERLSRSPEPMPSIGDAARALLGAGDREHRDMLQGLDASGGYLVRPELSLAFFDKARQQSRLLEAGASTVVMDSAELLLAVLESDPNADWRPEGANIATSDGVIGQLRLRARSLSARVRVTRELLMDAPNAGALITQSLAARMAEVWDQAMLAGDGEGSSPLGLLNVSGLSTQNDAGSPTYDHFVDSNATVRALSVEPMAAIMSPGRAATLAKLKDSTGAYLAPPADFTGLRRLVSAAMPDGSALCGNFSTCVLGIRETIGLAVGEFGTDAQEGKVSVIAHARGDFGVARPERIVKISDLS